MNLSVYHTTLFCGNFLSELTNFVGNFLSELINCWQDYSKRLEILYNAYSNCLVQTTSLHTHKGHSSSQKACRDYKCDIRWSLSSLWGLSLKSVFRPLWGKDLDKCNCADTENCFNKIHTVYFYSNRTINID